MEQHHASRAGLSGAAAVGGSDLELDERGEPLRLDPEPGEHARHRCGRWAQDAEQEVLGADPAVAAAQGLAQRRSSASRAARFRRGRSAPGRAGTEATTEAGTPTTSSVATRSCSIAPAIASRLSPASPIAHEGGVAIDRPCGAPDRHTPPRSDT